MLDTLEMKAPTEGPFTEIINSAHSKNATEKFCSLLERQILVDLLIFSGNQSLRAHKTILAANSPFFRSEFERNPHIEQVILGGVDFAVVKCLVEYMYSGKTVVTDEHFKYFKAAAKLLQIETLEKLFSDDDCTDDLYLPKPQFLTKKPSFFMAFPPKPSQNAIPATAAVTNAQLQPRPQKPEKISSLSTIKPSQENVPKQMLKFPTAGLRTANMRGKRVLKKQVEQACLKEAQASRMALANLQKEMGSTSQTVNFIVEDTCAETCMENFIPQTEENSTYLETLNHIKKENIKSNSFQQPVAPSFDNGLPYQVLCETSNFSEMQDINVIENNSSNSMPENHNIIEVGNFLNESEGSFNITNGLCSIVTNFGDEMPINLPSAAGMEDSDFSDLSWL